LSKAGKQKGMGKDTRSGLAYEVLRLVEASKDKPKVLIMENVPDLIQEKFVRQFGEIQLELEKLGYMNYVETLNAKNYGVAQNRNRVFMVSVLGDYSYSFPKWVTLDKRLKDYLEDEVDEKYYLSDKLLNFFIENSKNNQAKGNGFRFKPHDLDDEIAYSLVTRPGQNMDDNFIVDDVCNAITTMQGGNREPKIAYALTSREFKTRGWLDECPTLCARDYKDPKVVMIPNTICLNSKVNGKQPSLQDKVYNSEGISTAITTAFMPSIMIPGDTKQGYALANAMQSFNHDNCHMIEQNLKISKLTPREALRLMDVSNSDIDIILSQVSNTQAYKLAGNSIVVNVLVEIFRKLI
jgi:DNA (cytosine-5)-methyltransferase 1